MKRLSLHPKHKLNTICPYYTMFPLEFPLSVLKSKPKSSIIFDPFCGRGTTNYAARVMGMTSFGFDTSPIAVAIAKAKLSFATVEDVLGEYDQIMSSDIEYQVPRGDFWVWAYHPDTLNTLCKLRAGLLISPERDSITLLRAISLGCLHGPRTKNSENPSYFSNQMPRTFSSKPNYSTKFWLSRDLHPLYVDSRTVVERKAKLSLGTMKRFDSMACNINIADSTQSSSYTDLKEKIDLVITSPPYYGMRTYVQDQWLRNWFLGGPPLVDYDSKTQIRHSSPTDFSLDLSKIWNNISLNASPELRMIIRFGGIGSRSFDYNEIFQNSLTLSDADWKIYYRRTAGDSNKGKRQAESMGERGKSPALLETDYFVKFA